MQVGMIGGLGAEPRLAIEMLANEESERRWLEGELKLLERQWQEAERLAAIADELAVPEDVEVELGSLKARSEKREARSGEPD
jgi:hypothetical protein